MPIRPNACENNITVVVGRRRDIKPPRKSDTPHEHADAKARSVAITSGV
jgi:hypothetical protein